MSNNLAPLVPVGERYVYQAGTSQWAVDFYKGDKGWSIIVYENNCRRAGWPDNSAIVPCAEAAQQAIRIAYRKEQEAKAKALAAHG